MMGDQPVITIKDQIVTRLAIAVGAYEMLVFYQWIKWYILYMEISDAYEDLMALVTKESIKLSPAENSLAHKAETILYGYQYHD